MVKQRLIEKHNNPIEFIKEVEKLSSVDKDELIDCINDKLKINLCNLSIEAIDAGESVFSIFDSIEKIFPFLNHEVESLLQFLKICYSKVKNDYYSFKPNNLLEALCCQQPDFTSNLVDALLNINEEYVVNYINTIYQAKIKNNNVEELLSLLLKITKNKKGYPLQGIIIAISSTVIKTDDKNEDRVLDLYEELIKGDNLLIDTTVAYSLKSFLPYNQRAITLLNLIAVKKNYESLFQVSIILGQLIDEYKAQWFIEIFKNFEEIPIQQVGTIRNLDVIFYQLIKEKNDYSSFLSFIQMWIIKSDFNESDKSICKIWNTSLNSTQQETEFMSHLITKLFLSENSLHHIIASQIVSDFKLHKGSNLLLNSTILLSLRTDDLVFLCKKILGYVFGAEEIFSLLHSIVMNFAMNEIMIDMVCQIYRNFLGKDYSQTTINLLEEELCENSSLIDERYQGVINFLKQKRESYSSLPRLNELQYSLRQKRLIQVEESKSMIDIQKRAEKDSFMSVLGMNTIKLKYGIGSFHYIDGEYSVIHKLGKFSSSIEIPNTEITQPVSSALMRISYRLAKRKQYETDN
jgi:hypothetical protein